MDRHQPSGRRLLGLTLVMVTVFSWGVLPIILKFLLNGLDAYTLTWSRFGIAACLLGLYIGLRRGFGAFLLLKRMGVLLGVVCIVGATANYTTFLYFYRFNNDVDWFMGVFVVWTLSRIFQKLDIV